MLTHNKLTLITVIFILCMAFVTPASTGTITIVDSLGDATPDTQFSVFGSGGPSIDSAETSQITGPKFILTHPTIITEIGGFFVNCGFLLGVPQCPEPVQFVVQIRPSKNGGPDPSIILASFLLSKNNDVFVATYQSVSIDLLLQAGTYFALFTPLQDDAGGYIVGSATDPFQYRADQISLGFCIGSLCEDSREGLISAAVRILGIVLESIQIDIKPGSDDNCININGNGVIPVAILGSDSFDVTQIDVETLDFAGLAVRLRGQGVPQCSIEDVSGDFTTPEGAPDGYLDLVCQFVDDPMSWSPGDGTATLTGELLDGTPFEGMDSICIVP